VKPYYIYEWSNDACVVVLDRTLTDFQVSFAAMFSMKKVEGCAQTWCYLWDGWKGCNFEGSHSCSCLAYTVVAGKIA
jgi:hypothetical protein